MRILVLSTWFPFPTDQGSKIRAYHLIKGLSEQHEVALLSMQDVQVRPEWIAEMQRFCQRVEIVPVHPFEAPRWKRHLGFFSLKPSAVAATYSIQMAAAVHHLSTEWKPDLVLALTFVTAPYALQIPSVVRMVDMDNLLAWMLYDEHREAQGWVNKARTYLAFWKLRRYESRLYRQFDAALICSERDIPLAASYIPLRREQIGLVPNGIDLNGFSQERIEPQNGTLIFNGALTYTPNLDAMQYFHTEIFPTILKAHPRAHLTITGKIDGLDRLRIPPASAHLSYSGYLPDVRPAVAASQVCVVPLRKGAGTRLKILEAMAVGTPVVTTTKGAEGLEVTAGEHLLIGDNPQDFAAQTIRLLQDPVLRQNISRAAQERVQEKYTWTQISRSFNLLVDQVVQREARA